MRGFIVMAMFLASLAGAGSAGMQEQGRDSTYHRDAALTAFGDVEAGGTAGSHGSIHDAAPDRRRADEFVFKENRDIIVVQKRERGAARSEG
ncbi:MAG TPA: hypothetical protein PKK10_01650 [Woeseiaceae bacterium]|nr:hypothetical protein [Woeseiaceae bacterium]